MPFRGERLPVLLALAILVLAFVLPVGALFLRSFQVEEVVTRSGRVHRAVGDVRRVAPDGGVPEFRFKVLREGKTAETPVRLPEEVVEEIRLAFALDHYRSLLRDDRTLDLVLNSTLFSIGAVLVSLLLGVPVGWLLARTNLIGRRLLAVLCLGPAVLPPLIVAMGSARSIEAVLMRVLPLSDTGLQFGTGMIVFGFVFFPIVAFLVGRALSEVPVGPWEAALQLGGRRAAFRHVVLPAILPAAFGAATLVFVLAWSDFGVPDYLTVTLRQGRSSILVFPTEILLKWKNIGNVGRAVATGAPFMIVAGALVVLSLWFLRKSPILGGGEGRRGRPARRLRRGGQAIGVALILLVVVLTFVMPLAGIASWGIGWGKTVASANGGAAETPSYASLFDIPGAFERTDGLDGDLERWLKSGLGAAVIATFVAVVLARWAIRGGTLARGVVLFLGVAPLAVPGLVFTAGTHLLWLKLDVEWIDRTMIRSMLVLTARFFPFALLTAWLALRQVRRGSEEAAAMLGAGPMVRAQRIWGPVALRGLAGTLLVVLVLALREIDAVALVETRVFPWRLYDKIHFSQFADEATLCLLYVGILLVPALLAVLFLRRRRAT